MPDDLRFSILQLTAQDFPQNEVIALETSWEKRLHAVSASVGVAIAFNQRATVNFGYAHSWAFGTLTRTSLLEPTPQWPNMRETISRDLQVGRLLMGVTYRVTNRASINWSVEIGATEDAADVRTVLRVPVVLFGGG